MAAHGNTSKYVKGTVSVIISDPPYKDDNAWLPIVRDVNVLIFLYFSFRYDSVNQKYKRLKRYVSHYEILWHSVTLRNEFSALEYLIQR